MEKHQVQGIKALLTARDEINMRRHRPKVTPGQIKKRTGDVWNGETKLHELVNYLGRCDVLPLNKSAVHGYPRGRKQKRRH